jgi:hypothetical protein
MIPRAVLLALVLTLTVVGLFFMSRNKDELIFNGGFEQSKIGVGPMTSAAWDLGGPTTAIIRDSAHCYNGKNCG